MRYNEQLDEEFKKLGFLNFKDFLKTAIPLKDIDISQLPCENAILRYKMDDLDSDEDGIGYFFTIKKEQGNGKWEIESIYADFQLETERNREGVIVVGREYCTEMLSLLSKEMIRNEILQAVKMEKNREQLYLLQNGKNTTYRRFRIPSEMETISVYDLMNSHKLEKEINELGFNFKDAQIQFFVDNRRSPEVFITECPEDLGGSGFTVQFKINKLPVDKSLYLESIDARLFEMIPSNVVAEKSYMLKNGAWPTKEKICKDLFYLHQCQKIKEKFNFNDNKCTETGNRQLRFKR